MTNSRSERADKLTRAERAALKAAHAKRLQESLKLQLRSALDYVNDALSEFDDETHVTREFDVCARNAQLDSQY